MLLAHIFDQLNRIHDQIINLSIVHEPKAALSPIGGNSQSWSTQSERKKLYYVVSRYLYILLSRNPQRSCLTPLAIDVGK